ncbi:triose-phosphate isomerase [Candidatus Bathyarchaeota archaeon]|nr:triose-phosphate isomerase [Candidatus Bathyarchaeota archaeon]
MKPITFPLILVNLKAYSETIGDRGEELARTAAQVMSDTGICIGLAPQFTEIRHLSKLGIPIFSQHIDPIKPGAYTGHVLPEAIASAGAVGTILNHSERRLGISEIELSVKRAKAANLVSVVCADSTRVGVDVASLGPEIVAIEPPELIGTGIAVSKAKPEIVSRSVEAVKRVDPNIAVLCGAGISSGSDVAASIRLGSSGVLVASGVVKAQDWKSILLEMAQAAENAWPGEDRC